MRVGDESRGLGIGLKQRTPHSDLYHFMQLTLDNALVASPTLNNKRTTQDDTRKKRAQTCKMAVLPSTVAPADALAVAKSAKNELVGCSSALMRES